MNRLIYFALALLACATAQAGHGHRYYAPHVIVQQQFVPVPVPYLYSTVSPYLYQESVDARVRAQVERILAEKGISGTLQQKAAPPSIIAERCAKCHESDFDAGFTPEQYWTYSQMIGFGVYPEGGEAMKPVMEKLKADQKSADVSAYILQHPRQPAARTEQPPPAPPGEFE